MEQLRRMCDGPRTCMHFCIIRGCPKETRKSNLLRVRAVGRIPRTAPHCVVEGIPPSLARWRCVARLFAGDGPATLLAILSDDRAEGIWGWTDGTGGQAVVHWKPALQLVHVQKRNQEIIRGPAVVDCLATLAPLYFYKKLATHRKASGYPSPVKTEMRKTCNLSGGCMVCKCVKSMACKTSWVEAA